MIQTHVLLRCHAPPHPGMDWLCPGYSVVLARQLKSLHGSLTPENTIRDVVPIVQVPRMLLCDASLLVTRTFSHCVDSLLVDLCLNSS